jgi:hypothetical protein
MLDAEGDSKVWSKYGPPFYHQPQWLKPKLVYLKIKKHNKPQQSLPMVAGTAKTLRLFVCPCAGRYVPEMWR